MFVSNHLSNHNCLSNHLSLLQRVGSACKGVKLWEHERLPLLKKKKEPVWIVELYKVEPFAGTLMLVLFVLTIIQKWVFGRAILVLCWNRDLQHGFWFPLPCVMRQWPKIWICTKQPGLGLGYPGWGLGFVPIAGSWLIPSFGPVCQWACPPLTPPPFSTFLPPNSHPPHPHPLHQRNSAILTWVLTVLGSGAGKPVHMCSLASWDIVVALYSAFLDRHRRLVPSYLGSWIAPSMLLLAESLSCVYSDHVWVRYHILYLPRKAENRNPVSECSLDIFN